MDELKLETFVSGPLLNNCYLIFNQATKKGCLIDSPWESSEVNSFISDQNVEVQFILLTHAHFDHIRGLNELESPFYIHKQDLALLNNPQLNGSLFFGSPISIAKQARLYPEDKPLEFDGADIEIIHTPGHTPGSVSLKVNGWLFSGDTLFFDSIGRTDIPLASSEALISSIQEKLMSLPSDLKVYPGHGETTTIEREKKHNPFLEGQSL